MSFHTGLSAGGGTSPLPPPASQSIPHRWMAGWGSGLVPREGPALPDPFNA
jgi:hypothetical protein